MSGIDSTANCTQCGAPRTRGLAACNYCKAAYAGVVAGVYCPHCAALNVPRRTTCAACQADMTHHCQRCHHRTALDLVACAYCHHPFPHGNSGHHTPPGSRSGATVANNPCAVMGSLDDIFDS